MIKLFLFIIALSAPYVLSLDSSQSFGLYTTTDQPLELLKLETQVKVEAESFARVQYTFIYNNSFDDVVQTKFVFPPTTKNAIFHKFEATIQNQTTASKIVHESVDGDLKTNNCNPGFPMVPPNETVHITFIMIQPLEAMFSKFYELKLPAFINEDSNSNNNTHLNPEHWHIQIELESSDKFAILSNPTHRLTPELSSSETGEWDHKTELFRAFWNVTVAPNKEFIVYFGPEDIRNYTILLTNPQDPGANARLFKFTGIKEYMGAQHVQNLFENNPDAILKMEKFAFQSALKNMKSSCFFVIDRSDSMKGSPIQLLKKTLKVLLLDFAPYCRDFHIVSFGSTFEHYNSAQNLSGFKDIQKAIKWVDTIEADMGGSDPVKALNYIHELLPLEVFQTIVLTDGDISEPYKSVWDSSRYFIGIGEASKIMMESCGFNDFEFGTVVDHKDFGDQEILNTLQKLNVLYSESTFTVSTKDDELQNLFYKSNRYWYYFSKDEYDKDRIYHIEEINPNFCDYDYRWFYSKENSVFDLDCHFYKANGDCYYRPSSTFCNENPVFELPTKSATDIWHTVLYNTKIKDLNGVNLFYMSCGEETFDQMTKEVIHLSLQHQIFAKYYTSIALQTKSNFPQNDVCSAHSLGFFDLSKFNQPPSSPPRKERYTSVFKIPEDYIPFDSIQYAQKHANVAVLNQTESIDL